MDKRPRQTKTRVALIVQKKNLKVLKLIDTDKRHWGLSEKVHKRHKGCRTKKREFKNEES